jgi:peptidyl-Asp metalloendopeptidase
MHMITIPMQGLSRHLFSTAVAASFVMFSCTIGKTAELFEPLSPTAATAMQADQAASLARIRSLPTTASLQVVTVNLNALGDQTTTLALPDARQLVATESRREVRSNQDYTWHGTFPGVPGSATLVVRDGNVTGSINSGTDVYKVAPLGNGQHAIIKFDTSRLPPEHPPSIRERERRGDAATFAGQPQASTGAPVTIDVLVAYTPSAAAQTNDVPSLVQLAVAEANQSYVNSHIGLQLRLVYSYQVAYSEVGKSFDKIVEDLAGKSDGSMDEIHQLRDQYGADLVALIINQADYCGLADAILAVESTAFAAIYYNYATGYYSFAHELGHLMGARHDPANDPSTTPFPHGHGFQNGTAWRTIMAYDCATSCNRLQYWSNPNVLYAGSPMGTVPTHDNARVLNATASTIAGFRGSVTADKRSQ